MGMGEIRVGVGGWTYPPWRGPFYPPGLRQADELAFAASRLGAIEINGTAYRLQKAESFAKWAEAVPPGFAFTIKASYFCTNRKILSDAQGAIDRFFAQGLDALGDTLGPILWQFAPTKAFDPADFARFLSFLPRDVNGQRLRHAIEVRHESFDVPDFVAMARDHGVAIVAADSPKYPRMDERTADFTYARLLCASENEPAGYSGDALDRWADTARRWAEGGEAYIFFINGAKVRAPAAAEALIARLQS